MNIKFLELLNNIVNNNLYQPIVKFFYLKSILTLIYI